MKDYFIYHIVPVPLYQMQLCIILTDSPKDIRKFLPNYDVDFVLGYCDIDSIDNLKTTFVVFNPFYINEYEKFNHGVISHEALHAINNIFHNAGVRADLINDEPHAYLIHWVVNEIYDMLKRENIKID